MPPMKPTLPVSEAMRGQHADQEGTLVLLEDDGLHVGGIDHAVDQSELHVRQFRRHGFHGGGLGEAHRHDDVGAAPGHVAQGLFALCLGGGLEFHIIDAAEAALKDSAPL